MLGVLRSGTTHDIGDRGGHNACTVIGVGVDHADKKHQRCSGGGRSDGGHYTQHVSEGEGPPDQKGANGHSSQQP